MDYLFYGCTSLKSIDLSNWKLINVEYITNIFYNLENLEYLTLSDIQISSDLIEKINENNFNDNLIVCQNSDIITDSNIRKICCDYNFETHLCQSSNYITLYYNTDCSYKNGFKNQYRNDISFINYLNRTNTDSEELNIKSGTKIEIHYNTPITNIENYFAGEGDSNNIYIESIDLSQFDTSLVSNMNSLFYGCTTLKSIDFSNINTSLVRSMQGMFSNCIHLKSIDLSNFDTSLVNDMNNMFYNCTQLQSLNLSIFFNVLLTSFKKI
jgi:surface protein